MSSTKKEVHMGIGREIARAQDEKTQEKKIWHTMDIWGHFDFSYDWRWKMMSEKKKKNIQRIEY
jgi:hypothetical protein